MTQDVTQPKLKAAMQWHGSGPNITINVVLVCPYCQERLPGDTIDQVDAAREHVDQHTLEGEPDPPG